MCEVNNCKFWADGNRCAADRIYVVNHTGKRAKTDCKAFDTEAFSVKI
ncbi:DUF1540 domain-containing protein [Evansella vedderi]|nr:DUF1540 domain-containing protein [Evansella vedderi]